MLVRCSKVRGCNIRLKLGHGHLIDRVNRHKEGTPLTVRHIAAASTISRHVAEIQH
jgi:hypothetical protein